MLDHTGRKLSGFLNQKPLAFLALLCAIRDIALGVGYVFNLSNVQQTLLYRNYDALAPGIAGYYVGFIFILVGLLTALPIFLEKLTWTRNSLRISSLLWMFSTIMYVLYDEALLAIYISGFMMLVSGYLGYFFKFAPTWRSQGDLLRESLLPLTDATDRVRIDKKGEAG